MAIVDSTATSEDLERMHALYRQGGRERHNAPHADAPCPHPGCGRPLQAIDFRLEDHGRATHDPLVRAWWDDLGFVGPCPGCGGLVHFTIRGKRALTPEQAAGLPKLPDDRADGATIL